MSMDDQFEQLQIFARHLAQFNERLQGGVSELSTHHDEVDALWQDAMRHRYDAVWEPFRKTLQNYCQREAPAYDDFLKSKIIALNRYLHGN